MDTSVWVDHLNGKNDRLRPILEEGSVLVHPFVVGELACGTFANRDAVLYSLRKLPAVSAVGHDEALYLLEEEDLWGQGLGWVGVHILASTVLERVRLWTFDKSLAKAAARLGVGM